MFIFRNFNCLIDNSDHCSSARCSVAVGILVTKLDTRIQLLNLITLLKFCLRKNQTLMPVLKIVPHNVWKVIVFICFVFILFPFLFIQFMLTSGILTGITFLISSNDSFLRTVFCLFGLNSRNYRLYAHFLFLSFFCFLLFVSVIMFYFFSLSVALDEEIICLLFKQQTNEMNKLRIGE